MMSFFTNVVRYLVYFCMCTEFNRGCIVALGWQSTDFIGQILDQVTMLDGIKSHATSRVAQGWSAKLTFFRNLTYVKVGSQYNPCLHILSFCLPRPDCLDHAQLTTPSAVNKASLFAHTPTSHLYHCPNSKMKANFSIIGAMLAQQLWLAAADRWTIPQQTSLSLAHRTRDMGAIPTPSTTPVVQLRARNDEQSGTCGYIEGKRCMIQTGCFSSTDSLPHSLTGSLPRNICVINTYYGVHGCCDPYKPASDCTLLTACIPLTALATDCDQDCSSNDFIGKCSDSSASDCATMTFVYTTLGRTTTMVLLPLIVLPGTDISPERVYLRFCSVELLGCTHIRRVFGICGTDLLWCQYHTGRDD